ncbi:methyl-accepting chemotaxis protein [Methanospirillum sp.]|uniref:methyl-accepting chemotaxis protein n=1 Tax=Methanospirillum sp. TaxID=45200 RepID=UPI0035A05FE2
MKINIKHWLDNATIGQKIILICLILVIIPTVALGLIAYSSAEDMIKNDIRTSLETQVADIVEETNTVYDLTQVKVNSDLNVLREFFYAKGKPSIVNDELVLGSSYRVNNNFEIVDEVQRLLGGTATIFQKKGNQAIRISTNVIGEDGNRAINTPVSDAVYDAVINKGQTYYGTANVVGKNYITAYEPIKDASGNVIGILFVGVDEASTIGLLEEQIRQKKIGEHGYMYILNSKGTLLLHPSLEGQDMTSHDFVKKIIAEKKGYQEYIWLEGETKIAAYGYFEPFDWIIATSSDISDFTKPLDTIRNTIIIVVIIGIIAGTLISLAFGRSISRRMDELVQVAHKVQHGDLAVSINDSQSKDEIFVLGKAFAEVVSTFQLFRDEVRTLSSAASSGNLNVRGDVSKFQGDYAVIIDGVNETVDAMAIPLQEAMNLCGKYATGDFQARMNPDLHFEGEFIEFRNALNTIGIDLSNALTVVRNQMNVLSGQVDEITVKVNEVNHETEVAHKSIEDVSEGVGQVARIAGAVNDLADKSGLNTQQILAAMQDLATTVQSVAVKMEQVSVLTNTAAELSENGKKAANDAESGMKDIMQASSAISDMNQEISQQMQEIGRIVDMISSIAEETNLLALNAAIEAARAGEAGLGFAVVASEVKELANESQKSAEHIAGIISGLQKKSGAMADAVKQSLDEVENGNISVNETLEIFNEIVTSISVINSNMSEVAAASEEQAASVQEVTATVNEFSSMVTETAKESIGLAAASEESSAAVDQITNMVSQVNTSMSDIRAVTDQAHETVKHIHEEMDQFKV